MFNFFRKFNHRSGFTLPEVLVVIIIMGLITTISAAALFSVKYEKNVKTTAEYVRSKIIETRSYAMMPPDDVSELANVEFRITGYEIEANFLDADGNLIRTQNLGRIDQRFLVFRIPGDAFRFIADDPNHLGQIREGENQSICLKDQAHNAIFSATVNYLSGVVAVEPGGC